MNFLVCWPSIFEKIDAKLKVFQQDENKIASRELYLPFMIQEMLQANEAEVKCIPSGAEWFGVTYASDREKAVENLQAKTEEGLYKTPLW